jgi:hypothetical protein
MLEQRQQVNESLPSGSMFLQYLRQFHRTWQEIEQFSG